MAKTDIEKLRAALKASGRQQIAFSIVEGFDLAVAAQTAAKEGRDYIEISGWASTTERNDRGFEIAASTWQKDSAFTRLKKNSMVLFNHNVDFPIGQVVSWEARAEGLWATLRIRYNALLPTGEKIGDVIADGTLKALSIRLDILEFEVIETKAGIRVVVTECSLGEISVVSIPSDPGAVTDDSLIVVLNSVFQAASIPDEIKEESTMWKLLAQEYGMGDTATEAEVMAEYNRRKTLGASAIAGLGLTANFTAEQLTAALAARDPKKLEELNRVNAKLTAQNLVNQAVLAHQIAENDADTQAFALSLAESNPEQFTKWLALQKPVAPNTTRLTGAGATLGGGTGGGGASPYITKEDTEVCLAFGQLTPEKMDEFAETSPNTAMGWVLGASFPATAEDKKVIANRRRWDEACGVPVRA